VANVSVDQEPWHQVLLQDEDTDRLADLDRSSVTPMGAMRMVMGLAGDHEGGRLPGLREIYDSLERLPVAVDAARAELIAETIGRDPSDPQPTQEEWEPESGDRGLPGRDEGES
jgi:hypothetical protein